MSELSDEQAAVIERAREWAALAEGPSSKGFAEGQRRSQALLDAVMALNAAEKPTLEQVIQDAERDWIGQSMPRSVFVAARLRLAGLVREGL